MSIRPLMQQDADQAAALYRCLAPGQTIADVAQFELLIGHPGTTIWGRFDAGALLAMATLHILPNMTQGGRSYALIENVVTQEDHRGHGHGTEVMTAAMAAAWDADCYKIMLMTGKAAQARGFYERLGFNADEKWGMTIRRAPLRQS